MMLGIAPRVALFVSLILAVLIAIQTFLFSREASANLEELIGARLESIAATGALTVDGDAHERIRGKEDARGEDYAALHRRLARIAEANGVKPHLVYTIRPAREALEFVGIAEKERNDIGNAYRQPPPEVYRALDSGLPGHRGRYTTENGMWISGFAPIKNSAGKTVALLEVDYEISEFLARSEAGVLKIIAIGGTILLIGVILVFLAVRATTSRIVKLTALADSISRGEVETKIPAMGADEVGRLAGALERLRESVRTSLEMLGPS